MNSLKNFIKKKSNSIALAILIVSIYYILFYSRREKDEGGEEVPAAAPMKAAPAAPEVSAAAPMKADPAPAAPAKPIMSNWYPYGGGNSTADAMKHTMVCECREK